MSASLLWLATMAMEVSWLAAWSSFTLDAICQSDYRFARALTVFIAASLATTLTRSRRRHMIALHAAGLSFFLYDDTRAVWQGTSELGPSALLTLCGFVIWTLVIWFAGLQHSARDRDYGSVCSRFDRGLIWFFALFLAKLLLRGQVDTTRSAVLSETLLFPYFFFGVTAVVLARNQAGQHKSFVGGYRGLRLLAGFGAAVLLVSAGVVLLLAPALLSLPDADLRRMSELSGPLGRAFAFLLMMIAGLWLLLFEHQDVSNGRDGMLPSFKTRSHVIQRGEAILAPEGALWTALFWACIGACVVLVGWAIWRWATARHADGERTPFDSWRTRLAALWARLFGSRDTAEPLRLYRALLRWGDHTGLPSRRAETALEYGRRLQLQVPEVEREIDAIVAVFNGYAYGSAAEQPGALRAARSALRRLRSPRLWPRRFVLWFGHTAGPSSPAPA